MLCVPIFLILTSPISAIEVMNFAPSSTVAELDDAFKADLKNLNGLTSVQLKGFLSVILSFLATESPTFMQEVDAFGAQHGINARALKNLVRSALVFFKGALRQNITVADMAMDLEQLQVEADKIEIFQSQWERAYKALARSMVAQTLTVNNLLDMEWKFGVTASSDELEKVGSTYLQLRLLTAKAGGGSDEVMLELTVEQFYEFLAQMERVKASVDFLSG
jgi:COMM domain containing 7